MSFTPEKVVHWTVDFGDGRMPRDIALPHAWKQDIPVAEEGPVTYRTEVSVPKRPTVLRFLGVSYQAEVFVNGTHVQTHRGIWDAFDVPLSKFRGEKIEVEVRVTKNGGDSFPVRNVASGFLPYVYHTFGGIYNDVWHTVAEPGLPAAKPRIAIDGPRLLLDGEPFMLRGLLHWGWYPELGHTNPPDEDIRKEVIAAKALGFNAVKFCLWVPSHRYLEILAEEEMVAWLELPLWDPHPDHLTQIESEIETIVRQYRHHSNIVCWTLGCELSAATPPEFRSRLTQLIGNLTGCPLVRDNSGGAEMYGGDLREFGTFEDFHPYCDTEFYPSVLDSLLTGPRESRPILLGEFNDSDVHRDIARLGDQLPYWGSALSELNHQGVRWQHDLPRILQTSRFSLEPRANHHAALMESSRKKTLFIRKTVQEAVRGRPIAGYVITGWRDTPISTAGFFDDWDVPRFSSHEALPWNGASVLLLIPYRKPRWTNGGNRVGFVDTMNHFAGDILWKVGVSTGSSVTTGLIWSVIDADGHRVAAGATPATSVSALVPTQVAEIRWPDAKPGLYKLIVEFGDAHNEWPIAVVDGVEHFDLTPKGNIEALAFAKFSGTGPTFWVGEPTTWPSSGIVVLADSLTRPAPFWRESAFEFAGAPFAEEWSRLLPISGDRTIHLGELASRIPANATIEVLMNRIDVRTYDEAPVLIRVGDVIVTTLRPFGGLGAQPSNLADNPSGQAWLNALSQHVA